MDRWIDEYLARRYEGDWQSTGNHYYDRKLGYYVAGRFAPWNDMVSALSDIYREDTQHNTARLLVGVKRTKWTYDVDEKTGANEFVVGMCLLALHLGNQGVPTKVDNFGCGVHLMFDEFECMSRKYCERIVEEVRKLHARLLKDPQTIEIPGDVHRGSYR